MKIRNGFVSNSSSSSFVIFGKIISERELAKLFNFNDKEMDDIHENGLYDYEPRLCGLDQKYFSYNDKYLIGKELKGDHKEIIHDIIRAESFFGEPCRLYKGIDQDGELCLDDD